MRRIHTKTRLPKQECIQFVITVEEGEMHFLLHCGENILQNSHPSVMAENLYNRVYYTSASSLQCFVFCVHLLYSYMLKRFSPFSNEPSDFMSSGVKHRPADEPKFVKLAFPTQVYELIQLSFEYESPESATLLLTDCSFSRAIKLFVFSHHPTIPPASARRWRTL